MLDIIINKSDIGIGLEALRHLAEALAAAAVAALVIAAALRTRIAGRESSAPMSAVPSPAFGWRRWWRWTSSSCKIGDWNFIRWFPLNWFLTNKYFMD